MEGQKPLFDVTETAPDGHIAERVRRIHEASKKRSTENTLKDLVQVPHRRDRLASLALDSIVIMHGVEYPVSELIAGLEH